MKIRPALALEDARTIGEAAIAEALVREWAVTMAVCDDGGHLLWLQRMDGAPPIGAELGPQKAHASVMTRKFRRMLEEMVNNGRDAGLRLPATPIEGGEMIGRWRRHRRCGCIGGLAASGCPDRAGRDSCHRCNAHIMKR